MKKVIVVILFGLSVFASEDASLCIDKVQSFLNVEDNEAVTLNGKEKHSQKDCFLDMFTRLERDSDENAIGELVTSLEVQGKRRGISTSILKIDESQEVQNITKCKAGKKKLVFSYKVRTKDRRYFYNKVTLKKDDEGKLREAKIVKRFYSYRVFDKSNRKNVCRF